MAYREIFNDIKAGRYKRLYLFYGPEEYIKTQALAQMTAAMVPEAFMALNSHVMDEGCTEAQDIINSCETLPFMSEKRLVVVKDYSGFKGRKAAGEDELKAYMERIPESTCLVFYNRGDVDKSRQMYKAVKKFGSVIEFERLKGAELRKWTASAFKKRGVDISAADLDYFLFLVGNRLEDISNEVQKLAAYAGEASVINRSAIDDIVTPQPEHTVFQLIDAIAEHKGDRALLLLDELIGSGQAILGIIVMLSRQLRLMLQCKYYINSGYNQAKIAETLKIHPFVAKKCMKQCRGFTERQLKKALDECLELDYGIKRGKIRDRIGIEMLIVRMCLNN
jgi:DNA polymerase-3 subunit delta